MGRRLLRSVGFGNVFVCFLFVLMVLARGTGVFVFYFERGKGRKGGGRGKMVEGEEARAQNGRDPWTNEWLYSTE